MPATSEADSKVQYSFEVSVDAAASFGIRGVLVCCLVVLLGCPQIITQQLGRDGAGTIALVIGVLCIHKGAMENLQSNLKGEMDKIMIKLNKMSATLQRME
jgi:hypothetical protein